MLPLCIRGDPKTDPNNYHLISKLSCLSKILESLVNAQLKTNLNINSILSPHQSCIRPNHSTLSATTLVVNDIQSVKIGISQSESILITKGVP